MLPRCDSLSQTLSATTHIRSFYQPLAHTHGLAFRASKLIFSCSFLLCNNLHRASCRPRAPALCATALPLSVLHSLTLSVQPTNTQLKALIFQITYLPHGSQFPRSLAPPSLWVLMLPRSYSPSHSDSFSQRDNLRPLVRQPLAHTHGLALLATNFLWLLPSMQQPAPATFRSVCCSHSSCPLCSIHWYPLFCQHKPCHSEHG